MIQKNEIGSGLSGLAQVVGDEYARAICEQFPSENIYIYKLWNKNRRLLAILPEAEVRKITQIYGGQSISLPKGAKWQQEKRNREMILDRHGSLDNAPLSIPAIITKYKMSRTAVYTILRLEKARQKNQNN